MKNPEVEAESPLQGSKKEDETLFLNEGDWVIINFHNYNLYSQGFKTSELSLKQVTDSNIISSIFVVESYGRLEFDQYRKKTKLVFFGEKILLQHLLSGKYLSYSHHSSEEEIRLKYGKTGNCLFTIKPIFKCQAGFGRKIRIGEQICLQSIERLKMYIELGEKHEDQAQCIVSMRKHQSSILLLDRLNLAHKQQRKISNLLVYQLINIQTQSALDATKSRSESSNVAFLKNINIYGSFLIIQPNTPSFSPKEVIIEFNAPIFIRFYTSSLYLGFDEDLKVNLYSEKQDNCVFILESYDNHELKEDFTIKVKHAQSELYLSSIKERLELKPFSLVNTYSLKKVQHNVLKITLLVNEIYYSFSQILKENALRYRAQFEQLTRQLIKFIFSSNFNHQNYLKMNQNIKIKITAQEQSLLAKVGFIDLLAKAIGDFIDILSNSVSQGKLFYQQGISNLVLILLGICYKNQPNTEILIRFLPIIYEGIVFNLGIIEALYYLFSDGSNLRSFEKADHKIRKNKIRSIELLTDQLNKQKVWEVHLKEKIFRLLEILIKPKGEEKILLHQFSLIRALKQNRLLTIWNETKVVDEDVYVNIKDEFIELGGFFQKKARYNRQIDLIRAQFHFLCTLYSNPNTSNLIYFRTIFPQIALLNYLKTKIFAQQRKILLRILSEIYLNPLIIPHNRLINIQNDRQMQNSERMGDIDLRILEKIRDQIIDTFKQGIVNEIVDEALYLYIKAIRRFYELNLLEEDQWFKLQEFMQNYLFKNYSLVDKYKEVKKLAEEIIKSHEFSQKIMIYKYTKILINILKQQSNSTKKLSNSQRAQTAMTKILNEPFFSKQQSRFAFLNNLIEYCLQKDSDIFIKSCFLMKRLSERSYRLLETLKTVILLDNDWYCNIVLEGKEIHQQLKQMLLQYRKLQNQQESLVGINLSISKKVIEFKTLMYKRQKMSEDGHISPLIQNILRQLNIHETILTYIRDQQRQLREKVNNPIFLEMFDFLLIFFYKNFTNLNICIRQFRLIRWLFTYEDVGQSKILYLLVSDTYSLQKLGDELQETAILCIRKSRTPNCYGMMSLINLMVRKGNPEIESINFMVEQIINDSSLIELFWKINENGFLFQDDNAQNENFCETFGYYIFFVLKLFVVIIEYSSREKDIINLLKQRIPLKHVLSLLLCKDFLDENSLNYFGSYLMKIQAIKYIQKLYDFEEMTYEQMELYRDMCRQFVTRLSTCRTINISNYPQLSSEKGIYELQFQSQKIKDDYHMNARQTVHLIVITIFYPFLLLIIQKILHFANTQEKKSELQTLLIICFRKIKELLSNLPREKYRLHIKRYNQAIVMIEEVLKYKLNFELEERDEDFTVGLYYDYKQNRRYQIKKLHNIADNCMVLSADGGHANAVEIYQTIMALMYSPKVKNALDESTKAIKPVQNITALLKIIDNIAKVFDEQLINSDQALDLIWLFVWKNPFLIDLICKKDHNHLLKYLNKCLIMQKQDHFDLVLAKYIQINNYLMTILMQSKQILGSHIFQTTYLPIEIRGQTYPVQAIIQEKLMKTIKEEMKIYSCLSFVSHLQYFESLNSNTNYQMLYEGFSIRLALDYVSKQLAIINPNNREVYFDLVIQILQLLRVYIKFIKEFKLKYIPKELLRKVIQSINIIYISICPANEKIINYMHKESYHFQFEIILQLNDSWEICSREIGKNTEVRMRAAALQLTGWQGQWLQKSANLCHYSSELYGEEITNEWASFPLQASLSIFDPLKKSLLLVLRTLKCYNFSSGHNIILQIPTGLIVKNIKDVYYKHYHIFGRYTQISVKPQLLKAKYAKMKNIAQSFCFQNGVIFASLLMFIDKWQFKGDLELNYIKYCQYKLSYGGFLSEIINFFSDFRYLWVSSREKLIPQNLFPKILEYFYSKMARVEIIEDNQLYSIDFMIRPECIVHRAERSNFISKINFISTQVKLQTILKQCDSLSISFNCYANFAITFRNLSLILFIQKYLSLVRALNLLLLLANNIYLIINSSHNELQFYTHFVIKDTFQQILVVNLVLTLLFFIVFSIRQIPIISAQVKNKLEGQENYKDYTQSRINLIVFTNIVTNKEMFYNFSFLTLLFLAILNKLFVAILLIDILFQIKRMKLIFSTLWQSKAQIAYTFIAFLLIHYFYTMFIFLVYRQNVIKNRYCDDFGDCYGFIFNLCYKVVGGFPGYLYQQLYNQPNFEASFHIYDIFEDFYLIITYQIFYAVILVIITDEYSKNTLKYAQLREHLSVSCLICGLSRTIFNTSTLGNFRTHIFAQHNVWNYVYYYQYLKTKMISERNRQQNHIMIKRTIQWLPNGYAKGFQESISQNKT